MKHLIGLLIAGFMLLGPRAVQAQRGPILWATPPEPPKCNNDESGWKLSVLVPQSDIVALGHVQPAEQGVFKFEIDEALIGGGGVSYVDVMHYNPEYYGVSCAEIYGEPEPLFSPVGRRNIEYLMAFSIIENNQVQVNGILPIEDDQTFRVNLGEDDLTKFTSLTRDQLRHEIQGTTPTASNIPLIIMGVLLVVSVGAGIAAFIGWKRHQAT